MRQFIALAAAASLGLGPVAASAQDYHDRGDWRPPASYGAYDPCQAAKNDASRHGAVTGGLLGALAGAAVAGRGSRAGGALIGGAVGAVAGSQIARGQVKCMDYPYGYHRHRNCHWVDDRGHQFEVCRGPDGDWRPRGY